jgi:hypothetical protein
VFSFSTRFLSPIQRPYLYCCESQIWRIYEVFVRPRPTGSVGRKSYCGGFSVTRAERTGIFNFVRKIERSVVASKSRCQSQSLPVSATSKYFTNTSMPSFMFMHLISMLRVQYARPNIRRKLCYVTSLETVSAHHSDLSLVMTR